MEVKLTKAEERGVVVQRLSNAKEMLRFAMAGVVSNPIDEAVENMAQKVSGYRTAREDLHRYDNESKEGYKP